VRVLVVNAGSSSLKLSVLGEGADPVASENVPASGGTVDEAALRRVIDRHGPFDAIGHRVVHGGTEFVDPVVLTPAVVERLRALTDLAPLHQPASLLGIEAVGRSLPDVRAVACFDTAFHARMPDAAATYALPAEWRERWGLRRFGFHGLSHAWASRRAAELIGRAPQEVRVVTCHLGAGASLCAVDRGRSVDTTMGFTPLEGLVMATRSGDVDAGLVLWLQEHGGMEAAELTDGLEHRAGVLGLAGSADMREVLEAESAGDPRAVLAVGVYLHRLRAKVAAMAAAMDGLDAIVFTGGVGEHAESIRARTADGLGFLGMAVDETVNASAEPDADIGREGAPVRAFVIEAREDVEIARHVRSVLDH
jgi:acetate kinase